MTTNNDERTLGEMFAELSRGTRTLVQQEMQLLKTELAEKASHLAKSAAYIVGGGLIAYGGLLAIIAALILGLIALGLPPWLGALLAGVLIAGGGYLMIHTGLTALRPQELTPRQTIETLKEDAQWLRTQAK
jgi:Putative Actinobacterial Holin-X, holin superfamily III